jgi:hypothetical protein
MQLPTNSVQMWLKLFAIVLLAIFVAMSFRGGRISAQSLPLLVGRIEGDDVEVVTTTSSGTETNAAPTVVASGSEVTLRSGQALLLLNSGGTVSICGPAHFKMLKSAGAVTLALDYGRVHPALNSAEIFTIFTPTIIATPIAISGARRDLTIGLEESGEMCAVITRGAMRMEPQFSDQGLILPQGGAATLSGGQIETLSADASSCTCDFQRAGMEPPRASPPPREISLLRHVQPSEKKMPGTPPPATVPENAPAYTVVMPALTYDANSPAMPPDPDPATILLVREVRVQAPAFFRGRVNPAPAPAAADMASSAVPTPAKPEAPREAQLQPGFWDRVRNFIRKL